MQSVMETIATNMQLQIQLVGDHQESKKGDWSMQKDSKSGNYEGQMRIRMGSTQEVVKLEKAFHNAPISIGGEVAIIQIINSKVTQLPTAGLGNAPGFPSASRMVQPLGQMQP